MSYNNSSNRSNSEVQVQAGQRQMQMGKGRQTSLELWDKTKELLTEIKTEMGTQVRRKHIKVEATQHETDQIPEQQQH